MCDAVGTPAEATLIAVLVRTLVTKSLDQIERGRAAPPLPHEVLRANLWRAARDGLGGRCADPETGKLRPAFDILDELVPRCAGGQSEVDFAAGVLDTLRRTGGGADRQRTAFARRGRLSDVVDLLVEQTNDNDPREAASG